MRYNLQYTDAKSSKFYKIEQYDKTQTITYGKIGTSGKTITKTFPTSEAAIVSSQKLVNLKLKKGYAIANQEDSSDKSWFEDLSVKIFNAYKSAILKYPLKDYKYIQLHWTGNAFALGLGLNPTDGHHEYIDREDWEYEQEISLEFFYRELENIPYEAYDEEDDCEYEVEFERNEWPEDSTDCFELESFLINVSFGLAFIRLEKDNDVKPYLKAIQVIKIVASDRDLKPFTYHQPDAKVKEKIVQTLVKDDTERELILNLWDDKAKDKGLDFLNLFQREVTRIKDLPKLSLNKAYIQAYDLNLRFKDKEALEILQPVLEEALNNTDENPKLIEKCCDVMGDASGNVRTKYVESISWFKKGLEFVPNGNCALSLMSLYELDLRDPKALIEFCEQHLNNINQDTDVAHTVECYRYLGKGYLKILDKEKASTVYRKLLDFVTHMDEKSYIENVVEDLEDYSDWQDEYKLANEILTWLNTSATQ